MWPFLCLCSLHCLLTGQFQNSFLFLCLQLLLVSWSLGISNQSFIPDDWLNSSIQRAWGSRKLFVCVCVCVGPKLENERSSRWISGPLLWPFYIHIWACVFFEAKALIFFFSSLLSVIVYLFENICSGELKHKLSWLSGSLTELIWNQPRKPLALIDFVLWIPVW